MKINIENAHLNYQSVTLAEPSRHRYLLLAAEVDHSLFPFFLTTSSKKKKLIRYCKEQALILEKMSGVINVTVFSSLITPPGRGNFLKKRKKKIHIAKFDVVVLIEVENESVLKEVKNSRVYTLLEKEIRSTSEFTHYLSASNVKSMGPVNHRKKGVFLFNYFVADNLEQNLETWEYSAGWFQQETGLYNSTVLLPDEPEKSQYTIINHCRWDKLSDVLPSLLFKKSFRTYVLANFLRNNIAAIPILYKLA